MKISVIFTTYNQPAWLEKVLWGFFEQSRKDFEIVIADDGSTPETAQLIERMRAESPVPIRHVWQPDDGFQKCRILNKAIVESAGDYLIFTDGDCIPRNDFVEQHIRHAAPNQYLSGGYFKLPMDISKAINRDDVRHQRPFSPAWLKAQGMKVGLRGLKISARGVTSLLLNRLIPVKATWNGNNSSCFKELIYRVNGFNELMQYGGQDVEFGLRLKHIGVQPKRIRFSTIGVHLDHSRGYVTDAMRENSAKEIRKTLDEHRKWSPLGIDQYETAGAGI
jgi:glycosyltransferase involved in cell wall biosynthesis